MTDEELTAWVRRVSLTYFERPFEHEAHWNSRLRTTGGRFFPKDRHLDFNPKMADDTVDFKKIILHELCHYHLYQEGRGYRHADQDFKQLLAQVGGSRYAPAVETRHLNHLYRCASCAQEYPRVRAINLRKMRCGRCGGRLKEIML
ncbi:MAG: SprT family protein [Streptococcaceae bacterium]|jgi:SprT-like protein|nr:SprT family protein [Streptococcaceae bacterium]